MYLLSGLSYISKIILKLTLSVLACICTGIHYACQALSDSPGLNVIKTFFTVCRFSMAYLLISLVLSLVILMYSKNSTISLDIFYLINILVLVLYHVFKEPQLKNCLRSIKYL